MRKYIFISIAAVMTMAIFSSMFSLTGLKTRTQTPKSPAYIVIGWNDMGMHCSNRYFGNFCILPPYNNQYAQLIKTGDNEHLPQILTNGYNATYEIPGNTFSVGKTDFWTYVNTLFGVTLNDNIGLSGVGLWGSMKKTGNAFYIDGIPLTPYPDNDLINEHPYQMALIKVYDSTSSMLTSTLSVIPVSSEISCVSSNCHSSETQLLSSHPNVTGYNLTHTPILCANCHKDNALLKPGTTGIPSLSEVMHGSHADKTNNCYKCHPGPNTQCFRDVMSHIGIVCLDCHGTMEHIAGTINLGREAWFEEPDCGISICHGPSYASDTGQLYRNSKGHGGLYCSACHGSPHAIVPTLQANDNIQNTTLQGYPGTLNKCSVCHGITPFGAGPHGINASETEYDASAHLKTTLDEIFPNPAVNLATISFMLDKEARIMLQVFNNTGKLEKLLINKHMDAGSYKVSFDVNDLASGTYFYSLNVGNLSFTKKLLIIR